MSTEEVPQISAAEQAADTRKRGRVLIDTLGTIATKYRTTVQQLKVWNRMRGTRLAAGDMLTLYARPAD